MRVVAGGAAGFLGYARNDMGVGGGMTWVICGEWQWWGCRGNDGGWGGLVVLRVVAGGASGFLGYARNDMGVYGVLRMVAGLVRVGDGAAGFLGCARNDRGGGGNDITGGRIA